MTPEQETKLNELHNAIVGNPDYGQIGIVTRVKRLEAHQEKDKTFKARIAGVMLALSAILPFFAAWLRSKLFGE